MEKTISTIPPNKLRGIARNLLARTKAGEVNWVQRKIDEGIVGAAHSYPQLSRGISRPPRTPSSGMRYEVTLAQSRIVLTYGIPRVESNFLTLEILNSNGDSIDSWTVDEPDWGDAEDPSDPEEVDPYGDWRLLNELFSEVHRAVTGWDKVVSEIEKALAEPGQIGTRANKGLTGTFGTGAVGTLAK